MSSLSSKKPVDFLEQFAFLLNSTAREICLHGGRGSGKSRAIAQYLLIEGMKGKMRILCARQIQVSIRQSIYTELCQIIEEHDFSFYTIKRDAIIGKNGTEFFFKGLESNPASIKSVSNVDAVWLEESESISEVSLRYLIPTIRGGSYWPSGRIFVVFNPREETDPIWQRYFGEAGPPTGAIIHESNYKDNIFCTKEWIQEAEDEKRRDPAIYDWQYMGKLLKLTDDVIYRNWSEGILDDYIEGCDRFVGLDFGAAESPTAAVASYIIPGKRRNTLYIREEAVGKRITIEELPLLLRGVDEEHPDYGRFVGLNAIRDGVSISADPENTWAIRFLNDRGFNIRKATKGAGSVEDGINFVRSFDIVVHPSCETVLQELRLYRWDRRKADGEIMRKPIKAHDHTMDAIRYSIETLMRLSKKREITTKVGGINLGAIK